MKLPPGIRLATAIPVDDALVERANGPGTAPTAFRIWAAGENVADDGSIFFTARSAELLLKEQADRGRLYPSDFDHLSLMPNRPAEAGRASGWHRLEVRQDAAGEPELWAVDIDWCADAKAGLEEDPPRWRYFSPAFRTKKDGEVTSYTNFALCINPLTHQLPSLASETTNEDTTMKKKALLAALAKMYASDATDDEKKEAQKTLSEYLEGLGDEGGDDKPAEEKPEEKKAEGGDDKPAEEKPEEKKADGCEEKTEAKAAAAMAQDLVQANKRIEKLELDALLEKHKDQPESVRKWCATQSLAVVKSFLGIAPKVAPSRPTKPTTGITADGSTAPGLEGAEKEELDRLMGMRPVLTKTHEKRADGSLVIHAIRPSDWRRLEQQNARSAQEGK